MTRPHDHRCDPTTIDYSAATERVIVCEVCERTWRLLSSGWQPDPVTRWPPPRAIASREARAC